MILLYLYSAFLYLVFSLQIPSKLNHVPTRPPCYIIVRTTGIEISASTYLSKPVLPCIRSTKCGTHGFEALINDLLNASNWNHSTLLAVLKEALVSSRLFHFRCVAMRLLCP